GTATQTVTLTVSDYLSWNYALSFTTDCPSGTTVDHWNMLVRLSENPSNGAGNAGFRYAQANSNGGDLRFIDQHGQELKYEIANWNTSGESQVWVRVPSLTSDSNFTMLWGNTAAPLPAYTNDGSVWSDYFGVYHLEGASGSAVDSSPANNVLTALNSPTLLSDGFSGKSYTISGDKGFMGSISNGPSAKEGTYIIWTKNTSGSSSTAQPFGVSFDDESAHLPFSKVSSLLPNLSGNGSWRQVVVIIKDGYFSYYLDGSKVGSSTWHFPGLQTLSELALGRKTDANGPAGSVDEASFSSVTRSATWIAASYNNQKTDQSSNPYLNFETLNGPVSLNDPAGTKIYGKKGSSLSFTIGKSGSGSFSANGLPNGLSINASTGEISGTPTSEADQDITITATGTTAGGTTVSVTKLYKVIISDPASFPYRMNLTLSGYTGSTTLTDFPVLVSLGSSISGFSYNGFLDGDGDGLRTGGDLRFFASSGQELAYEIADWNTSGTSHIWVKVPSISGTNTVITAAWGKSGTGTMPDYATHDPVWSNGYEGVWHLDTISSGKTNDSSPQGIHLTVNGGATTTAGQTGSGISLDGTDDDLEALGYKGISGGAQRSMQLWIKTTANAKAIMHWGKDDNFKRWTFRTTDSGLRLRTEITGGGRESNSAIGNNEWTHISATFPMNANNLNDIKFYVNGTQSEETSGSTSMPNTSVFDNLLIGNDNSNRRLPGIVDEVRLSSVERYADWIKAEYDNQKSSQSLVSYGSVSGPRTITSPLSASGTFGSSFTYTLTASDPSNISSRVFYGLPQGLDFNNNGQITGTPEVSGTFEVALLVNYNNDDGDTTDSDSLNDKLGSSDPTSSDAILLTLDIATLSPSIDTLAATSVGASSAYFEGNVTSTGGQNPEVIIYYGTSDGGSTASSWSSTLNIGNKQEGVFSILIGDLSTSSTYYYRVRASNASEPSGVWATSSQSFSTTASAKAIVANGALANANGSSGTLSANISSFGTGTVNIAPYTLNTSTVGTEFPGITLWLDAADSSSIITGSGSDVASLANKVNSNIKLYAASSTPSTGGSINGVNALTFDTNERLDAKAGSSSGAAWSPLGINGATNSTYNDFGLIWVVQINQIQNWNNAPFNFGWGGHIPGYNGNLYWDYPGHGHNRMQKSFSTSTPYVMTFYGSTTDNKRIFSLNGVETTGTAASDTLTGGFFLPGFSRSDTTALFGEMLVIRGTMTDTARHRAEGYLGHKWGITLNSSHPWASNSPYFEQGLGADVSLYWGSSDGGTDLQSWENNVSVGWITSDLSLWLDASELTTAGTTWTDKSGRGNHATKNGSPTVVTNAQNGLSVMRYSGADSEYHEWADLTDIRTIFWVIKANSNNAGFLLGDDDSYHFHNSSGTSSANIWASYASSNVINGNLAINGTRDINGQTTA
ncbi:MAG: DUF2341 domain-containing protein, partial [Opitutae bacterium]|nr:DUF2341 domain-containing protein [Opitutae bacterium]